MHTAKETLPGRAKEDATEDDDQGRGKDECVKWHLMFRVHLCKEATRGKSSVSVTFISTRNGSTLDRGDLTYLAKA